MGTGFWPLEKKLTRWLRSLAVFMRWERQGLERVLLMIKQQHSRLNALQMLSFKPVKQED